MWLKIMGNVTDAAASRNLLISFNKLKKKKIMMKGECIKKRVIIDFSI